MSSKLRNFLQRFFLINDSPHKIAAGAALGAFLGIVPGEGLATTLVLASLLRFNRLSATAGVMATNMWGTLVLLPGAAAVGGFFFGINKDSLVSQFLATHQLGWKFLISKVLWFEIALPLIVGFVITAGALSLLIYFLLLFYIKSRKKKLTEI